ncbi:MAG: hypothetical protein O3C27_09515 [Actinomycetota bacterium]|nr:hypothetical protein [Actinomycetota bacterium]
MRDGTSDSIRLAFPASPEFARIARIGLAGLAFRLGIEVAVVERLRLAADLCVALLAGDGRIVVEARWGPGHLDVDLTRHGSELDEDAFALAFGALAALVDRVEALPEGISFGLSD